MKELKIFAVVAFFTLLTYWGVEPYAHSQMHKHVESHGFSYGDLSALGKTGDATKGAETFQAAGCIGCHAMESAGMPAPMDPVSAAASFGVNPPDLSTAGAIYSENFLADLIKNPAHALKVEHKFKDGKMHPMTPFMGAGGDLDQEVADIVAFMKAEASKAQITPEKAYIDACGRCHSMRYSKWFKVGSAPAVFKTDKDEYEFKLKVADYEEKLKAYMGTLPPDLSIMIRARSHDFMTTFIEDPQSQLPGTSMPRVGLTKEGTDKVLEYMTQIGDPSKPARASLGPWVIGFAIIFTIFAYLWKNSLWRDLH